jgi:hypothetical protein
MNVLLSFVKQARSLPEVFYVDSCAFDYATAGDVLSVETYRETYNAECGAVLDFKSQSRDSKEREQAAEIAADNNLGMESVCEESSCGANGYCSGSSCACEEGYLGNKCEFSVNEPEKTSSV